MSLPAQSPQGDQPRKALLFSKLKTGFATGGLGQVLGSDPTQSVSPPVTMDKLDDSKADLVDKLFSPAPPVVPPAPALAPQPTTLAQSTSPTEPTTSSPQEEFSSDFLSDLLSREEKVGTPVAETSAEEPLAESQVETPEEPPQSLAAAIPTAIEQAAADSLNPAQPVGGKVKEVAPSSSATSSLEAPSIDIAA